MLETEPSAALESSLDGLRLLDHPFYRRWQEGLLEEADLAGYAEQYRHFEQVLPEILSALADLLPAGEARALVERNFDDETSRPSPHIDLFEGFAKAVRARSHSEASPATRELVGVYRDAVREGPAPGLAVVGAYEVQAGDIAATKAASLTDCYGVSSDGTRFWEIHGEMEADHAEWTAQALQAVGADAGTVSDWSARSARAWWSFLDERLACCAFR